MTSFAVASSHTLPMDEQPLEIVERKGVGHPDTICDAVAEEVSLALCREYQERTGRVLHHNVDKALLIAGSSAPRPGGGEITEPMRLLLSGRATSRIDGVELPIADIARTAAELWLKEHLRFVRPGRDILVEPVLKHGSPELTGIFERKGPLLANDTSAAVGFSPLSPTEKMVIATERMLASPAFKAQFPEVGEDVKVMALRRNRDLHLTVAMAFVSRYIESVDAYFTKKDAIRVRLEETLAASSDAFASIHVDINTLDDRALEERGMYLTVSGTSAENADEGQVGRGNKVNGIIPLLRPIGTEAAAGKNPVSHVGKIYNFFTHHVAARLTDEVPGLREVTLSMVSQIGAPLDTPFGVRADLCLAPGADERRAERAALELVRRELSRIDDFVMTLVRGERSVW